MKSRVWCLLIDAFLVAGSVSAQAGQFGDFTYESSGSGVTITGYTGSGGDVSILEAETYAGLTIVGEIGKVYSIEYVDGPDRPDRERLTVPRVSAIARQPVSVGGQVGDGDGEAILPGGGNGSAGEHGFHPAGDVSDGKPDQRSGSRSLGLGGSTDGGDHQPRVMDGEARSDARGVPGRDGQQAVPAKVQRNRPGYAPPLTVGSCLKTSAVRISKLVSVIAAKSAALLTSCNRPGAMVAISGEIRNSNLETRNKFKARNPKPDGVGCSNV